MTFTADILAILSGSIVGLVLGLVGGGGSILAVPLLVYVVGVSSAHVALGTSALAVALTAVVNLIPHSRAGRVKWRCAGVFAAAGIVGAYAGSSFAKTVDGSKLLVLFGFLMLVVGIMMLRRRSEVDEDEVQLTRESAGALLPRLVPIGFGVGALSGFFGIGGGFLIVPGLILATRMRLASAIGTSLVAVAAFGATTATNYAISGMVNWPVAGLFIAGGAGGGVVGVVIGKLLGQGGTGLRMVFSGVVIVMGAWIVWQGIGRFI